MELAKGGPLQEAEAAQRGGRGEIGYAPLGKGSGADGRRMHANQ